MNTLPQSHNGMQMQMQMQTPHVQHGNLQVQAQGTGVMDGGMSGSMSGGMNVGGESGNMGGGMDDGMDRGMGEGMGDGMGEGMGDGMEGLDAGKGENFDDIDLSFFLEGETPVPLNNQQEQYNDNQYQQQQQQQQQYQQQQHQQQHYQEQRQYRQQYQYQQEPQEQRQYQQQQYQEQQYEQQYQYSDQLQYQQHTVDTEDHWGSFGGGGMGGIGSIGTGGSEGIGSMGGIGGMGGMGGTDGMGGINLGIVSMGGGGEGGGGGGGEGVSSNGSNPYKGGDKRQRKVGAPVSASALVTVSASALVSASTSPSRSPSASVSSRCAKAARLTKARGGSIEDEEEQGVGEFAEFGGSGGGAIVKYEVVCKLAPLLPVPKNDIRRLIPAMFVNALNSASAAVILNYFSTFMQGCCTYDELNTSNRSLDLPTNINLTGPQRMTNYLLGLAVMMPDISFRLREARMITSNTRKGTTIHMTLEVTCTKMFHLGVEDWFPEGTRIEAGGGGNGGGSGDGRGGNRGGHVGGGGRSGLGGYMEGAMPWETWAKSQTMAQTQAQMARQASESQDTSHTSQKHQSSSSIRPRTSETLNGGYALVPDQYMNDLFSRATLQPPPTRMHAFSNGTMELDENNCIKAMRVSSMHTKMQGQE